MMRPSCRSRMIGSATVNALRRRGEVAVDHQQCVFRRQLVPMPVIDVDPGIVEEDVEAPQLVPDEIADPAHRAGLGQVARLDVGGAAQFADPRGDFFERGLSAPRQHNRRAFACQHQRRRLADAATAARHPHDLAFELRHPSLPISGTRPYRLAGRPTRGFARLRRGDGSRLPLPAGFCAAHRAGERGLPAETTAHDRARTC